MRHCVITSALLLSSEAVVVTLAYRDRTSVENALSTAGVGSARRGSDGGEEYDATPFHAGRAYPRQAMS